MSLLRPGVIKQHKTQILDCIALICCFLSYALALYKQLSDLDTAP